MFNILILAGKQFNKDKSSTNKALVEIRGKKIVEYVVDVVKKIEGVSKIFIVSNKDDLKEMPFFEKEYMIESDGTIIENILTAVKEIGYDKNILICSSDIPMITLEAVNDFLSKTKNSDIQIYYPIVKESASKSKYPEMKRTYIRLKEGNFTGGNIFYLDPLIFKNNLKRVSALLEARKKPIKMAYLLGPAFLIRFIAGRVTIQEIEKKILRLIKIKGRAIVSDYPEISCDIDKPGDFIVATAYLDSNGQQKE